MVLGYKLEYASIFIMIFLQLTVIKELKVIIYSVPFNFQTMEGELRSIPP